MKLSFWSLQSLLYFSYFSSSIVFIDSIDNLNTLHGNKLSRRKENIERILMNTNKIKEGFTQTSKKEKLCFVYKKSCRILIQFDRNWSNPLAYGYAYNMYISCHTRTRGNFIDYNKLTTQISLLDNQVLINRLTNLTILTSLIFIEMLSMNHCHKTQQLLWSHKIGKFGRSA